MLNILLKYHIIYIIQDTCILYVKYDILFGTVQCSLFEPDDAVNYDYIVTNSINYLLIGSKCIPNGAHTNHSWAMLQNISKTPINWYKYMYMIILWASPNFERDTFLYNNFDQTLSFNHSPLRHFVEEVNDIQYLRCLNIVLPGYQISLTFSTKW